MVVTRINADQKQSHAAAGGGYRDYGFSHVGPSHMHPRFLPHVFALAGEIGRHTRVLDVGCGNGYTVGQFLARGCEATGIDLSETGIAIARATYPKGRFEIMCAAGNLSDQLSVEPFDLVVSTEVVEHLYDPRAYAAACFAALRPGGRFIVRLPTTVISRTFYCPCWVSGTLTRTRFGTAGTSNFGAGRPFRGFCWRRAFVICGSAAQAGFPGCG